MKDFINKNNKNNNEKYRRYGTKTISNLKKFLHNFEKNTEISEIHAKKYLNYNNQ